jgi:hypothetical protein
VWPAIRGRTPAKDVPEAALRAIAQDGAADLSRSHDAKSIAREGIWSAKQGEIPSGHAAAAVLHGREFDPATKAGRAAEPL